MSPQTPARALERQAIHDLIRRFSLRRIRRWGGWYSDRATEIILTLLGDGLSVVQHVLSQGPKVE